MFICVDVSLANPSPAQELGVQCLEAVLSVRSMRQAAWKHDSILSSLIKQLKAGPEPQMQYWIVACFWQLSYEPEVAEGLDK